MATGNSWHESVPDALEFDLEKKTNLSIIANDFKHREAGLNLLRDVGEYGFGHKNTWMGIPIIRLPEDLILQQEIIWSEKPDLIIEVGVARGGGLVYNASLQEICGIQPNVVGVDNKIFRHTHTAISNNRFNPSIRLIEGDSISREVTTRIQEIVSSSKKTLLILDSDHSSNHVLNELRCYVPLLPIFSIIMVCDTLIDEYPEGTYENRTWSDGKGPLDAITRFRAESKSVEPFMENESRALILSEIRDGLLKKVSN
jgi:cephalosporin hydroxylase